jgi:hypothetical protein
LAYRAGNVADFFATNKKPAEAGSFLAINDILSANILSAFILEMARHP